MELHIDQPRLEDELDQLAAFSSEAAPVVTRIVFSPADRQARTWLKALFAEAGLSVREDAIGNTFARWVGSDPQLSPVGTGSHIDAIPNAGKYDGTVGVLGALEALRALQRSGFRPKRSIELLLFTAEEPTRFGIGCLGSRMLAGSLSPGAASELRDAEGASLDSLRGEAGFSGDLEQVLLPSGYYSAFVELHIEQGPILDTEGTAIGIVTSIAAPASFNIAIEGQGGHAGTVLMADRKDAFMAAAELATIIERLARSSGAVDTVATIGKCDLFPGAVNSIPSKVKLTLDLRDTDLARRDLLLESLYSACREIGERRGVAIEINQLNADSPAECSAVIISAIRRSCERHQISSRSMVSRAYHDSLFVSRIAPAGMIFIPCRDGISHRPDEYSSAEQITTGVLILAETLAHLANATEYPA
ncbi:N-carbamoyl-L-amino acid hydrolase [Acidisarcina polymorpha]|uniref:N-carbamoyl-L-amino acid hydrolase n=1 Tax=Acidisarcina polymorpha TaxID=2211140 RepID=A0A2Z5FZH9_9BACT|nr:M20 family metallo-hydrolase [Acidisarcina polymorpha]AXC11776.1 N-carbamoyl-L-amino acid hydrolase [Acidisarcina polymorpha]